MKQTESTTFLAEPKDGKSAGSVKLSVEMPIGGRPTKIVKKGT